MSQSTGPVVAAGAITAFVGVVIQDRPLTDLPRIAISTGIAAGGLLLIEQVWPDGAVALSWLTLLTVLLVRLDPKHPAPAEAVAGWLMK